MSLPPDTRTVAFVYTADLGRAITFYTDIVGLSLRARDEHGAFLEGAGALVRVTPMPGFKPTGHPALGWDVDDLATAVDTLRSKGVAFTVYEGMGQDANGIWTSPDGQTQLAWFADPDGNAVSLSTT
jgi:catechol 2,3-dioxygenase-like lactoylglutathione lyase family enzyme